MTISYPAKSSYIYLLSNYGSEVVFEIGGSIRSLMSNRLKLSLSAVTNSLSELNRVGLLYRYKKGLYQINPRYAFRGSTSRRNKALKAIIEIGCKDC